MNQPSDVLPPGLWYDAKRHRYRVRVYRRARIIHLSYHHDLEAALHALDRARALQDFIKRRDGHTIIWCDMVHALAENLI